MIKKWISAARPKTLPTSIAPVITATGLAWFYDKADLRIGIICALFAITAQIASNFANDYFDFKKGSDGAERVGPRRGVASGDIKPAEMLAAAIGTLAAAAILGSLLIPVGGITLVLLGGAIIIFALLYSAGPYPLSYHGLGEITVFIFFGIVPVCATYWLQTGDIIQEALYGGAAMGLLSVNILLVNNYRDRETDKASGKYTAVVILGKPFAVTAYLLNGILASILLLQFNAGAIAFMLFLTIHVITWVGFIKSKGVALNRYIGRTALNQAIFTIILIVLMVISKSLL